MPISQSVCSQTEKSASVIFSIKIDDGGKQALMKLSNGDMRRVLNILQSTWMAYKNVTEANVYSCVGHPTPENIKSILNWLLSTEDFKDCYDSILLHRTHNFLFQARRSSFIL